MTLLSIPSPADGVWDLGPFPIRGYALCIIAGIVAAIWIGERRWAARGGTPGQMADVAVWAVPFGLVGGRVYHVITDSHLYFGDDRNPVTALYIWKGGLGIWGAIALGGVGAVIGAHRMNLRILPVLDTLAPGVLVAQAFGRWGNWFNQELFGKPTDQPWGLEIDARHRMNLPEEYADATTFHPTFLYESLWCLAAFGLLIWLDRRFKFGHGRALAVYVMLYTAGRVWIETLRIDDVQLDDVLGLRLNVWTSIILFVAAAVYFLVSSRRHPGREESVYRDHHEPAGADEPAGGDEPAGSDQPAGNDGEPVGDTGD
jgi:prolipoprotein diacylglyceryl transferase